MSLKPKAGFIQSAIPAQRTSPRHLEHLITLPSSQAQTAVQRRMEILNGPYETGRLYDFKVQMIRGYIALPAFCPLEKITTPLSDTQTIEEPTTRGYPDGFEIVIRGMIQPDHRARLTAALVDETKRQIVYYSYCSTQLD